MKQCRLKLILKKLKRKKKDKGISKILWKILPSRQAKEKEFSTGIPTLQAKKINSKLHKSRKILKQLDFSSTETNDFIYII